jgi:hypothetical protein
MPTFNTDNAQVSNYDNAVPKYEVEQMVTDGVNEGKETEYNNPDWAKYWGYFNNIAELKTALLMKSIWDVGKGYTTDNATKVILEGITGWGKDTFDDILFNMDVISRVNGDSFAEIVRNEKTGTLINLKPLDPGVIKIIVNGDGIIDRYEQVSKIKGKKKRVIQPKDMLHFSNNRLADQIHGISDVLALESIIKADQENFEDVRKMMHHQAIPFILWKLKTDKTSKITEVVNKIEKARKFKEDMFIPDDDNAISHEVIELRLSQVIMDWRADLRNKFYRSVGLPQIVPGGGGQSTESESKVIYLAFEQIVEKDQRRIEKMLWNQLAIKINLIPPATLSQDLQTDESKDAQQQLSFQPSETQVTQPQGVNNGV